MLILQYDSRLKLELRRPKAMQIVHYLNFAGFNSGANASKKISSFTLCESQAQQMLKSSAMHLTARCSKEGQGSPRNWGDNCSQCDGFTEPDQNLNCKIWSFLNGVNSSSPTSWAESGLYVIACTSKVLKNTNWLWSDSELLRTVNLQPFCNMCH